MPFIRNKSNYIVKVRIDLGDLLGCENPEDAFIELRELDTKGLMKLRTASTEGEEALMDFFKEILPEIIVKHNLYEDEDKLMSNEDIAELVFSTMGITSRVMETYSNKSFRSN